MKDLVLIGGGGHCKSVIDVVEAEGRYSIKGILDKKELAGTFISGYEIIGTDSDILMLAKKNYEFLITVGQVKSPAVRRHLYDLVLSAGGTMATVCSPLASISRRAGIGKGTIIMHHAVINAGTGIGNNCIINTKALIEHDCTVGDHCHIATAAVVNGNCTVADECFIGSNSVMVNGISVAPRCVAGAGSVLTKNISEPGALLAGNPARTILK